MRAAAALALLAPALARPGALRSADAADAAAAPASSAAAPLLQPVAWKPLPAGAIKPRGWLLAELELQADSLYGHMDTFWEPMQNSQWLGGTSTFEDWVEIAPYVFDGLAALAPLVNDTRPEVAAKVGRWLQYVVEHPQSNGWIGPYVDNGWGMQYWVTWPVFKAMIAWMEFSGDATMLPAIMKQQRLMAAELPKTGLGYSWQGVRWGDWGQVNEYLIDSGLLGADDQAFLLNLTWAVYNASQEVIDWERKWFVPGYFPTEAVTSGFNLTNHGVNTAQALKSGAVYWRFSGDRLGIDSSHARMQLLDRYHGVPSGIFQADEHLAGTMPSHGTETCAVNEAIFSWSVVHEYLGDAVFAERAETVLYNAMPAALTKNLTARVYLQSSNEVAAVVQNPHVWYSDGDDAAIYSLQGNYACCTATLTTGWNKATAHAVHASPDGGVAVSILAPVVATLPGGGPTVTVDTEYPFGDDVTITVAGANLPGTPLYVRIPSWATNATLAVNGGAATPVGASAAGTMLKVTLADGGAGAATVVLATNPAVRLSGPWHNGAIAVHRGALLYTLQLEEVAVVTRAYSNVSFDFNVTLPPTPRTPWNLALVVDPSAGDLSQFFTFSRNGPIPFPPFASQDVPLTITAKAVQVPSWGTVLGQPDAPPASPVDCATVPGGCGAEITVTLVPFGTTQLRLTEVPYVLPSAAAGAPAPAA